MFLLCIAPEDEINITEVVPGDIVIIKAGDKICGDMRIIECSDNFTVSETALNKTEIIWDSPSTKRENKDIHKNSKTSNRNNPFKARIYYFMVQIVQMVKQKELYMQLVIIHLLEVNLVWKFQLKLNRI